MSKEEKYQDYHESKDIEQILKLREIITSLPPFCKEFFLGIKDTTSARTRLAYAYDLRIFFEFFHETNSYCSNREITQYGIEILDMIKPIDLVEYMDYLSLYIKDGEKKTNSERGKQRKFSAVRSMYKYFYRTERIEKNPALLVEFPKIHKKEIIRLDVNEVAQLLDNIESGEKLSKKQLAYHDKTRIRDLAIMTLLLGTGIRVSECVGLDLTDVDFNNGGILVKRKGGNEQIVYFGKEVEDGLHRYLEERKHIIPMQGHEQALFLSLQNRRISVRAVELLVKKYANTVTKTKKITPHKLRSTFGTNLYRETGDIYLVAEILGHSDVNTTRSYYAAQDQNRLRMAANAVKLREE